jgi:hypothetical protein
MATGKMPFEEATSGEICGAILHQPLPPVWQVNPEVPAQLEGVIHKALVMDRELRYQHVLEMRADLTRVLRDSSSASGMQTDLGKFKTRAFSWKRWVLAAAGAVALLLAGLFWWRSQHHVPSPGGLAAQTAIARCCRFRTQAPTKISIFSDLPCPTELPPLLAA